MAAGINQPGGGVASKKSDDGSEKNGGSAKSAARHGMKAWRSIAASAIINGVACISVSVAKISSGSWRRDET